VGLAQINIRFRAELGEFEREMKKASKTIKSYGKDLKAVGKDFSTYLTAPLVAFGATSLLSAGNFEAAMKNVEAITSATGAELAGLGDVAKEMGKTTVFSATQAADAMAFLGMAGFDTKEIISALPEVLSLAAAGGLDLARAADIASNVMGQFSISAADTGRVTNVLAATAASANTNIDQLAEAMVYLGPTAASLGMSLEDAAGIIGVLGDAGIQGSMAGRALSSSLVRLSDPTTKMQGAMAALGLSVFDANGNFAGMEVFLSQVQTGLKGFTQEQKAANLTALLGAESFQEINILLNRGSDAYGNYVDSITNTNKATEMAATRMEGLNAVGKEVASAFEFLQIKIAESGLQQLVTDLGSSLAGVLRSVGDLNPHLLKTVTIIAGLAAAVGPVLFTLGLLSSTVIPGMIAGVTLLTAAIAANPIGALAVAALAAAAAIGLLTTSTDKYTSALAKEQAELNGLVLAVQQSNIGERVRSGLIDELQKKYPAFLKSLDIEKATNEQLQIALQGVNKDYERRIILEAQQKELTAAYTKSAEKLTAVGRARLDLTTKLAQAEKIEGVEIKKNVSSVEAAADAIEQISNKRRDLARGKSDSFSFDEFAKTQSTLQGLKTALEQAEEAYKQSGLEVQNLKMHQEGLLENLTETTQGTQESTEATADGSASLEVMVQRVEELKKAQKGVADQAEYDKLQEQIEALDGQIEDLAPVQEVVQSVADLKEQLQGLIDVQQTATDPGQWSAYQQQIDAVANSVDRITAGLRGGLDLSGVTPTAKSFVRQGEQPQMQLKPVIDYGQDDFLRDIAEASAQAEAGVSGLNGAVEGLNAKQLILNEALQVAVATYGENSNAARVLGEQLNETRQKIDNTKVAIREISGLGGALANSFAGMPERAAEISELERHIAQLKEQQKGVSGSEWDVLQEEIAQTQGQIDGLGAEDPFSTFLSYIKNLVIELLAAMAVAALFAVILAGTGFGGLVGAGAGDVAGAFKGVFAIMSGISLGAGAGSTSGKNGTNVPGFAAGAYVTGPTLAVIGEGSQNEYVLPENKLQNLLNQVGNVGSNLGKQAIEVTGQLGWSADQVKVAVAGSNQRHKLWANG
jgi:TP901 family phage tail tape measure protein